MLQKNDSCLFNKNIISRQNLYYIPLLKLRYCNIKYEFTS